MGIYIYIHIGTQFHPAQEASTMPRWHPRTQQHRIHDEDRLQLLEKGLCYLHQTGWSGFCCRRCWKLFSVKGWVVKGADGFFVKDLHGRKIQWHNENPQHNFRKNRSKQTLGAPVLGPFQRTDSSRPRALGPSNGDLATVRLEFQSRTSCWSPGRGHFRPFPRGSNKRWILWMAKPPSPR